MSKKSLEQKSNRKNSGARIFFAAVSVMLQVLWFLLLVLRMEQYSTVISVILSYAALIVVIWMFGRPTNSQIKTSWIVVILAFPVFGVSLYLLFGRPGSSYHRKKAFDKSRARVRSFVPEREDALLQLAKEDIVLSNQAHYLQEFADYPVYTNSDVTYYSDTAEALAAQKAALADAKHFIFLEYFAIENAEAFEGVLAILSEKAKGGVIVRILYDDVGSAGFINPSFIRSMEEAGIECRVFNPVVPFLRMFMNHRDHRKIMICDGETAFTGGYNLANEYFNIHAPYGRWKDAGIRVKGEAVTNFTVMFLEMWNGIRQQDDDMSVFFPKSSYRAKESGYVQPYADSPLDYERVGENAYLNLIKSAVTRVYIMTPYLILSDEMVRELTLASKRGVDVRIVIPKIPDKKMVYRVTCSYLALLTKCGIRVYKYTPGFCHAKVCLADERAAVVGTINFDYRSLFHHFEDACLFSNASALCAVREDFLATFLESEEVTEIYRARPAVLRTGECLLRLIAPLL